MSLSQRLAGFGALSGTARARSRAIPVRRRAVRQTIGAPFPYQLIQSVVVVFGLHRVQVKYVDVLDLQRAQRHVQIGGDGIARQRIAAAVEDAGFPPHPSPATETRKPVLPSVVYC